MCSMHVCQVMSENKVLIFLDANQLATTLTASAFVPIEPDVGYAGVHAQAEICAPKLCSAQGSVLGNELL